MTALTASLFPTVVINSAVAFVLATVVWSLRRRIARPELLHLLWLLVLVKLVTPGVLRVEAIPLPSVAAPPPLSAVALSAPVETAGGLAPASTAPVSPPRATIDPRRLASWLWFAGSALLAGRIAWRSRRFARLVRRSRPLGGDLAARVAAHAATLGIRPPQGRIVAARLSPMICGWPHRPLLLLPEDLVERLARDELDALIVHELAHVARRDPWVRWVEVAVIVSCWWNPIAWWARANLRRAEEQACDARVLRQLPHVRRAYADGIVKTLEFLAGHPRTPALATGADGTRLIKERLAMILNRDQVRYLRRPALTALLLALLVLPVVPGFAERGDDPPQEPPQELLEIEQRQAELERRLLALERQRAELHHELERMRAQREEYEMRRHAEELRRSGNEEEATRLEAEAEAARRRAMLERQREEKLLALRLEMMQGEQQMHEKQMRLEREHEASRDRALAAEERAILEYRRALESEERAQRDRERAYEEAEQQAHLEWLEAEIEHLSRRAAEAEVGEEEKRELYETLKDLKQEVDRIRERQRERGRAR